MRTLALLFVCLSYQLGFGGSETNAPVIGKAFLAPLPLRLPAPAFLSLLLDVEHLDPHVEPPRPAVPRPPFLAPVGVTNLAYHKLVTTSDETLKPELLQRITDGDKGGVETSIVHLSTGKQWVQIDLGSKCAIYAILVWHDQRELPIAKCVVVQTSDNENFGAHVRTLFNNDYDNVLGLGEGKDKLYFDTYEGRLIDAKGVEARYVRCYSKGTSRETTNPYTEIEVWGLPDK
jgi:hypothetical protein